MKFCILAPGPSMSQGLADSLRAENCIVVNNCYQLAPWAMALAAQDHAWWRANPEALNFAGRKFSSNKINGVEQVNSDHVRTQSSSGVLSLEVAHRLGATHIELHGFDNKGSHYFGPYTGNLRNTSQTRFNEFQNQFEEIGKRLKKLGVRIVNRTPDSALRCFPFE